MSTYDVGDTRTLTGTFRNAAGALTDPTAVVLTVRKPDGTETVTSTTHASTGVYTAAVSFDQSGVWRYRFEGTGTVAEAGEQMLTVRRQRVGA